MILEDLHERYLPTKPLQETIMLKDGTTRSVDCTKYHQILIGGDQLTVARVRGAVGMKKRNKGWWRGRRKRIEKGSRERIEIERKETKGN